MLKLYHGSNVTIEHIDLSVGHINKDFGKGFKISGFKFLSRIRELENYFGGGAFRIWFELYETVRHAAQVPNAISPTASLSKPAERFAEDSPILNNSLLTT